MDKEQVTTQLVRLGLITRARLATPTEANVETLNEWSEMTGQAIRFRLEGVGTASVRGYITWDE